MRRLVLILVGVVAYVLGAKAGRERYEQIVRSVRRWREDPRVQEKASEASDVLKRKAPAVKERVSGAVKSAAGKVGSNDDELPPGDERSRMEAQQR